VGIGRFRQEMAGEITGKDASGKTQKAPVVIIEVLKLKNYSLKK
jgi:hypothetical protein